MAETIKSNFKARSHILSLLGDELIGSDHLAIFELVKNSYDADAKQTVIKFINMGKPNMSLIIEDDGIGMSIDTLLNSWLEIGTDFKRGLNRKISTKFKRESLGEKGVGRLAVHKLASDICLETCDEKTKQGYEMNMSWPELIGNAKYIEDTEVVFEPKDNLQFINNPYGTRITLKNLRRKDWERGDIRALYRTVNTLISPFDSEDSFKVSLILETEFKEWVSDIFDAKMILASSVYEYHFYLESSGLYRWEYFFRPPFNSENLKKYSTDNFKEPKQDRVLLKSDNKNDKIYKEKDLKKFGDIKGKLYLFNQRSEVLKVFNNSDNIKNYLNENHGIRVYRDRLRVYNYGEPGNDWLGLNLLRANNPGKTISNNNIIGAIQLNMNSTHDYLKEKTNREGFDENDAYIELKEVCLSIIKHFATIIQPDRDALETHIKGFKPVNKIGFAESIGELRTKLESKKLTKEFAPVLSRIEDDYSQMREVMLNSGLSGMNLSLIFHELHREVKSINYDINKLSINDIKERINFLFNLIEGFSPILKQNQSSLFKCKKLFMALKQHNSGRINYHNVIFSCPTLTNEAEDFQINGPENLLFSAVNNLIDNSIYWTSVRFEKDNSIPPAILLTSTTDLFNGPAIIVADNGEGFKLRQEDLTMPFKTLKPGGMGLGLYYTSLVMELCGGSIIFMDPRDMQLPAAYTGAAVALVFYKEN